MVVPSVRFYPQNILPTVRAILLLHQPFNETDPVEVMLATTNSSTATDFVSFTVLGQTNGALMVLHSRRVVFIIFSADIIVDFGITNRTASTTDPALFILITRFVFCICLPKVAKINGLRLVVNGHGKKWPHVFAQSATLTYLGR